VRTLAACAPQFRVQIAAVALICRKSPDAVFALWSDYARRCENFDQSPILGEFLHWHAKELGSDNPAQLVDAAREAEARAYGWQPVEAPITNPIGFNVETAAR
jgi:hypothetical protein